MTEVKENDKEKKSNPKTLSFSAWTARTSTTKTARVSPKSFTASNPSNFFSLHLFSKEFKIKLHTHQKYITYKKVYTL